MHPRVLTWRAVSSQTIDHHISGPGLSGDAQDDGPGIASAPKEVDHSRRGEHQRELRRTFHTASALTSHLQRPSPRRRGQRGLPVELIASIALISQLLSNQLALNRRLPWLGTLVGSSLNRTCRHRASPRKQLH